MKSKTVPMNILYYQECTYHKAVCWYVFFSFVLLIAHSHQPSCDQLLFTEYIQYIHSDFSIFTSLWAGHWDLLLPIKNKFAKPTLAYFSNSSKSAAYDQSFFTLFYLQQIASVYYFLKVLLCSPHPVFCFSACRGVGLLFLVVFVWILRILILIVGNQNNWVYISEFSDPVQQTMSYW